MISILRFGSVRLAYSIVHVMKVMIIDFDIIIIVVVVIVIVVIIVIIFIVIIATTTIVIKNDLVSRICRDD